MPLVSIIIPYFNKSNTIARAVTSVLKQTHSDWELIIVDDASDIPLSMHNSWASYPVRILRNPINLGPGPSRQLGMENGSGDFFSFLDADDWWNDSFLEKSLNVHYSNPLSAATWAVTEVFTKDQISSLKKNNEYNHKRIVETLLKYGHPWSTSSLVWKKRFLGSWGELTTNQDSWFEFTSSRMNNDIVKIDEILVKKDETLGNHRVDLVKLSEINENRFKLYSYIIDYSWDDLDIKHKLIAINRFAWIITKVGFKQKNTIESSCNYKTHKGLFLLNLLTKSPFSCKLIHFILQHTKCEIK